MRAPQRYNGGRKRKNADLDRLMDFAYWHERGECITVPSTWDPDKTPKANNSQKRKDYGRGESCPFCDGVEDIDAVRGEYRSCLGWDWVTGGRLRVIRDQIEESRIELECDPLHRVEDLVQNVAVWLSERPEHHHPEHWAAATRKHIQGKDLSSRIKVDNPPSQPLMFRGVDNDGDEYEVLPEELLAASAEDVFLAYEERASMNRYGCKGEPCELDLRLSSAGAVWAHELLDSVTDQHGDTGMTDGGFRDAAEWLISL